MENKVSATIPAADIDAFKADMKAMRDRYPWLVNLTPGERKRGLKLGDRSLPFVQKVLEYMRSNPEFIPSYMDRQAAHADYQLWIDLNVMIRANDILRSSLSDTANIVGVEVMYAVHAYYNAVKEAARYNAPGAQTIFDSLKGHFGSSAAKKQPDAPGK